jgi:hypothetical protein
MAYTKNEKKLKEYLKKKDEFKQPDSKDKINTTKPSNVKNIRRG